MLPKVTFFPVGNGDMVLIQLEDKSTILIDINIREAAENEHDPACNVSEELRKRIERDELGRPYVDVFLLSHPDEDHCRGLKRHFHLGPLDNYNLFPPEGEELKIVIREIWSSPRVFRRASKNYSLCEDAKAFNTEAKRRVKSYRENGFIVDGDRIIIICEDENGKTDDLGDILIKIDEVFSKVNGTDNNNISMRILAPIPFQEDENNENLLQKNHSSVIIQFCINVDGSPNACLYLTGGDAEVFIWEKIWERNKNKISNIQYNLLLAPHHCSWHTLSYDSWSKCESPKVSQTAKSALSQACEGAFTVSSSKPIKNDKNDPPCWGAKKEYLSILRSVDGEFFCTGEYPNEEKPEPLTFKISKEGPQPPSKKSVPIMGAAVASGSTREPRSHG